MSWGHYEMMTSVEETIKRLKEYQGRARLVAGGTDLLIQLREEAKGPKLVLLDISGIQEIRGIRESAGYLLVGAATTISEIVSSSLVWEKARVLGQGAGALGSPQIKSVATIGGNVVNALPAADTTIPLIALGAEARVVSLDGEKLVPVEELFRGVGVSAVDPSREVLTHFRIPLCEPPRRASAMERLARRRAFTLPTLSVAVSVELDETGDRFSWVRIVAAPVGPVPWRARRAEEALRGEAINHENIAKAAALARDEASPRTSLRGGADYRREMMEVLVRRALFRALSSANREVYG